MKARPKPRPQSIVSTLKSGPFVAMLVGCVLLGLAALGRIWHEHRNELLRKEISRMERDLRLRDRDVQAWRVRGAQLLSPQAIKAAIKRFGLDLAAPSEDQFLRVVEPRWELLGEGPAFARRSPGGDQPEARRSSPTADAGQEVTMR